MTSTYSTSYSLPHEAKHPLTAALWSILPGAGQLYVGHRRKGIFFLLAGLSNLLLFLLILNAEQLADSSAFAAPALHMHVNHDLVEALHNIEVGSISSFLLIGMMVAFSLFCARDAYDRAVGPRPRLIYRSSVLDLSEASSGSYLLHSVLIAALGILGFFFIIPAPPKMQSVRIIMLTSEGRPTKRVERVKDSTNKQTGATTKQPVEGQGAPSMDPKAKPKTETQKSEPDEEGQTAKQTMQKPAQPQPAPPRPMQPRPVVPHPPSPQPPAPAPAPQPVKMAPAPVPALKPLPAIAQARQQTAAAFTPIPTKTAMAPDAMAPLTAHHEGYVATVPTPMPLKAMSQTTAGISLSALAPKLLSHKSDTSMDGAPLPKVVSTSGITAGQPAPVAVAMADSRSSGAPPPAAVQAASKGSKLGSSEGTDSIVGPKRVSPYTDLTPGTAVRPNTSHNPFGENTDGHDGSENGKRVYVSPSGSEPDFGPYMANLQRLIKKHWFPPKDLQSKRVVVLFNISKDGNLSNLRISRSSGYKIADDAALVAVENAAPFAQLPTGAPPAVDIEFTFDYNIFTQAKKPVWQGF